MFIPIKSLIFFALITVCTMSIRLLESFGWRKAMKRFSAINNPPVDITPILGTFQDNKIVSLYK